MRWFYTTLAVLLTSLFSWSLGFQTGASEVIRTTKKSMDSRIQYLEKRIQVLDDLEVQTKMNMNSVATVVAAQGELANTTWNIEQVVQTYMKEVK